MRYFIEPVAKPRMTQKDKWDKRPIVQKYWAYKGLIQTFDIELILPAKVTFHVSMPKSWSKKKRALLNGQPHLQTPDIDNYLKGFLDALYEDDKEVWSIWAEKRWSDTPGITVEAI